MLGYREDRKSRIPKPLLEIASKLGMFDGNMMIMSRGSGDEFSTSDPPPIPPQSLYALLLREAWDMGTLCPPVRSIFLHAKHMSQGQGAGMDWLNLPNQ